MQRRGVSHHDVQDHYTVDVSLSTHGSKVNPKNVALSRYCEILEYVIYRLLVVAQLARE